MKLLTQYLSLCWFRNSPADLIPTKSFMWKTVAFYLVSGMIVEFLIADVEGIIEVLFRTFMAFSTIISFLLITKKWQYFRQVFIAIFICENFLMTTRVNKINTKSFAKCPNMLFWCLKLIDKNILFENNII